MDITGTALLVTILICDIFYDISKCYISSVALAMSHAVIIIRLGVKWWLCITTLQAYSS